VAEAAAQLALVAVAQLWELIAAVISPGAGFVVGEAALALQATVNMEAPPSGAAEQPGSLHPIVPIRPGPDTSRSA
jgi:hypothetical protein